jgi:hypothetical protein
LPSPIRARVPSEPAHRGSGGKAASAREGKIKRLIINIPPSHLKSLAASIALPAWWLGHDPTATIVNVTYGQELSDKFARDCRSLMLSSWYQALSPTRLVSSRAQLQELMTTSGWFRMATSAATGAAGKCERRSARCRPRCGSEAPSGSTGSGRGQLIQDRPRVVGRGRSSVHG